MARTVNPVEHAARRGALLDAAAACFAEKGFDGTRTADIVARAGTSTGNLFHYFPSKQALVVGLLDRERDETAAYLDDLLVRDDPRAALDELLGTVIELAADPGYSALALEISAAAHRSGEIAERVGRNDSELRTAIATLVDRARDCGQVAATGDVAELASWVALLVDGLFARVGVDPTFDPRSHAARLTAVVSGLLDG